MNMNHLFMELYRDKYGDHINRDIAESIVADFSVTDGSGRTTGEKWSYEEARAMGDKVAIDWEKVSKCEFYVVLNMMYSDYFRTAKKHGMTDIFFGELAFDWFNDEDGAADKTFNYFIHL